MFDEVSKYKNNGHFFFRKGDNLAMASKQVPDLPGVYYIFRLSRGMIDLVYIGKAGTVTGDGNFKEQMLRGRLNNKQEGIKRQEYFNQKIMEEDIDALDIYWYVTFDKTNQDLPGYVEGLLLQRYFELNGKLPQWNHDF